MIFFFVMDGFLVFSLDSSFLGVNRDAIGDQQAQAPVSPQDLAPLQPQSTAKVMTFIVVVDMGKAPGLQQSNKDVAFSRKYFLHLHQA